MKWALPRKRVILAFHRWLGFLSALFLVILALTGLALNHTAALGLDRINVRNGIILSRYEMVHGGKIQSFQLKENQIISYLEPNLYLNGSYLATGDMLVGVSVAGAVSVVATPKKILLLASTGELVEEMGTAGLGFTGIRQLGTSPMGKPVLVTDLGNWIPDDDWLKFEPFTGTVKIRPLETIPLGEDLEAQIMESFQGSGVTLYRVLLDLHSGRLFGWGGRTVMDLAAVAILMLVSSGIVGWLRKSHWRRY